jgi:[CysO sulfur-carrier protein]-S-L-cysteine hydrolase
VEIERQVLAGIADHARREAPRECCGLLVGNDGLVDEYIRTTNVRPGTAAYRIDPAEHFAAIKRTRQEGRTIIGAYHSHPRSPAVPSPTDLAEAVGGGFLYLIVSLRVEPPDMRLYRHNGTAFAAVPFAARA